jgi:hypothetical protein
MSAVDTIAQDSRFVMPGLGPGIHVFLSLIAEVRNKTWMAGTLARSRASSTRYARP